MPGDFRPRNWTRRARRRGGLFALAAALVVFSYWWVNWAWIGIIALDAFDMVGVGGPVEVWMVIGLVTIVALPVFGLDLAAGWWSRKDRRER